MRATLDPDASSPTMTEDERAFIERARVARFATVDAHGAPHLVPVCFALSAESIYITVDEKPKRTGKKLARVRNIEANPAVALVVDHYAEDWAALGWVMVRGRAEILASGAEHDRAQALLRDRYVQYRSMRLEGLPVIAMRIERVTSWGAVR